jgi:uncharacterized protein YutE (UPF0331/DUF86 family)
MVDAERLTRILNRVRTDLADLRSVEAGSLTDDDVALRAVKYSFVTAIEGCVRAAQHILSSEGLGVPETNAAAIRLLGERGVVNRELARRVARAVGFRNVLVHEYADVDDAQVIANLDLLPDLAELVSQLSDWAEEQS